MKITCLLLVVLGLLGMALTSLFKNNRLLFWCMLIAVTGHAGGAALLWGSSRLLSQEAPKEVRVKIAAFKKTPPTPPPPKKQRPPEPKFRPLDLPLGSLNGSRKATKMPKGTNLRAARSGAPGKAAAGGRTMVSGPLTTGGSVAVDPDASSAGLWGPGDPNVSVSDIRAFGTGGGGGGTPDGEGDGDVPAGFPNGKIGGRVYFIRLKHGSVSAWNAYDDGTRRLLSFLNKFFPCESDSRAMTASELRERYTSKGAFPCFIYIYCDDSFSLNSSDVTVLRDYMDRGQGFLFLDSRPDPSIREAVAREMDKVLPGVRLSALGNSHPINSFMFRLSQPGVGENIIDKKNYGITRKGRLVVFYTMGNFSHLYSNFDEKAEEYVAAQYQMGANVMLYAINKGDGSYISKRAGASASVTTNALEKMGFLEPEKPSAATKKPEESVKVKPIPPPTDGAAPTEEPEGPDEIKLLD